MEENPGTKPLSVFPLVNLCHSSTWLASDLQVVLVPSWIADLEDRKFIRAQNLAKGLDGFNFIPSCLWFNAAAESG